VSAPTQTVCIPPEPLKKMYTNEKIIECDEFSEIEIDKFEDDMDRYRQHKTMQEEESKRLEVNEEKLDFRSHEKIIEEMKFFYTILKMQNKKKKQMNEAELKVWNMRGELTDTEDNGDDDEDLYSTDEDDQEDMITISEDNN